MNKNDKSQFEINYQQLLKCLKLQGKADKTIEAYSRAIRRVSQYFDCLPEDLTPDNLKDYFAALVESHSWSTVKIDRLGLQFYWRHVLNKDWRWVDIVKPPKVKTLPDILTPFEIERLLSATRKLRYRVFLLTTYSMGLRLEEALCLQVGDIAYMDVGKGREQDAEALMQSVRWYTFVAVKGTRIECCRYLILP